MRQIGSQKFISSQKVQQGSSCLSRKILFILKSTMQILLVTSISSWPQAIKKWTLKRCSRISTLWPSIWLDNLQSKPWKIQPCLLSPLKILRECKSSLTPSLKDFLSTLKMVFKKHLTLSSRPLLQLTIQVKFKPKKSLESPKRTKGSIKDFRISTDTASMSKPLTPKSSTRAKKRTLKSSRTLNFTRNLSIIDSCSKTMILMMNRRIVKINRQNRSKRRKIGQIMRRQKRSLLLRRRRHLNRRDQVLLSWWALLESKIGLIENPIVKPMLKKRRMRPLKLVILLK